MWPLVHKHFCCTRPNVIYRVLDFILRILVLFGDNFFSRIMQSSDRFSVKQSKYLKRQVLTDVHGAFGSSSAMTGLSKFNHPHTRLEVSCAVIGFMLHRFTEVQLSVHKMATVNRQHVLH